MFGCRESERKGEKIERERERERERETAEDKNRAPVFSSIQSLVRSTVYKMAIYSLAMKLKTKIPMLIVLHQGQKRKISKTKSF